jgi:HD-GYP domain-containing protein (c-di-GMP phosphodiesterase class II)
MSGCAICGWADLLPPISELVTLLSQPSVLRLSDVLAGLSHALDLTEGQREGHAVRTCLIGMRIADVLRLDRDLRSPLFYALLMKDLGCSSNAARFAALFGADDHDVKADLKVTNWSHALESFQFVARNVAPGQFWLRRVWQLLGVLSRGPEGAREVVVTRCERGADIARMLGFPEETAHAIRALDEHWDGQGQPYNLKGNGIPLLARILGLAQTAEVFFSTHGPDAAFEMAIARRGRWFDPAIVEAFLTLQKDTRFWQSLSNDDLLTRIAAAEPTDEVQMVDDGRLDLIADAFALVIDAKSPWTFRHSKGVADRSVAIGRSIGFSEAALRDVRRAALLHDIGKLGVSSLILDKPEKLTDTEFAIMRRHPVNTRAILSRTGCFSHLADVASSHHERLDGRGYDRGVADPVLPMLARILCAADICDALSASRPYREGMPPERVLAIMKRDVGSAIDPDCYAALERVLERASGRTPDENTPAARSVPALAEDYAQAA